VEGGIKAYPLFVMLMVLLLKIWQRNKLVASNKKSPYAYIALLCVDRGSEQHKGEQ
jgi:heme A synthase